MAKGWRIRIGKLLRTLIETRNLEIRININPIENRKNGIAVEIKSFFNTSAISEFHTALGQFINYRLALSEQEADRTLYLAVPIDSYTSFFTIRLVQNIIKTIN